ncbi:chorismate-binding protein [Staphylococcus canis]|uniref:Anthranilate synthase component I family protein n=1 Tax=Staphylococcus canis TaxID=2724942 RepID=A0ABS0T5J9_9STAP|nr:anthranilate synthase component I family protein [Staphylococcus canis]MBI5974027.1 anthranilate synthase component I family protein [Staphylococcus canis]
MVVKFNYVYYQTPKQKKRYQYTFDNPVLTLVAKHLSEVGSIVDEAEHYQKKGYYVALYLPYEAAAYYNDNFKVYTPQDEVYAACYVFDKPINEDKDMRIQQFEMPEFYGVQSSESIQTQIRTIHEEITAGWTYQVNYTTRFKSKATAPISQLYTFLTQKGNGNYTVMIDTKALKIASISPELFFQVGPFDMNHKRTIVSKPMKGTIDRGQTKEADIQNYNTLAQSLKDRAENVMIVDLLRNDIARIARKGSVRVENPFFIETYETVFQMTTMVLGEVEEQVTYNELFEALFPCGSITGAPKVNTMRIINRLETTPRHGYCGTIGLLHPNGEAIFNVPIRTVQEVNDELVYGVGAGITIDSDPQKEYEEFLMKTKILEG